MTIDKIVFIEDELRARNTYVRILSRIFGDEFEIVAPEPAATIEEMMLQIQDYSNVVSYLIDEKLTHTGEANYTGTELVSKIREIDQKVLVYILTSDSGSVDPFLGDIEFVIDKRDMTESGKQKNIASRIRRHLNTFNDIKSERADRLDFLLKKSINDVLSVSEHEEYERLNFLRARPILQKEDSVSEACKTEQNKQAELLKKIEEQLRNMDN